MRGTDQASNLMAAIRHEIFRPEVTTMGSCSRCRGGAARGGGVCVSCRVYELEALVGHVAVRYLRACEYQREVELAVLRQAGGRSEG